MSAGMVIEADLCEAARPEDRSSAVVIPDDADVEGVDVCDFFGLTNVFCVPQLLPESGYELLAMLDGAVPAVELVDALYDDSLADSVGEGDMDPIGGCCCAMPAGQFFAE